MVQDMNDDADGKKVKIDVVLMDQEMPVLDGNAATMEIRKLKLTDRIPILGVTANARSAQQDNMLEAGMDAVVRTEGDVGCVVVCWCQWTECRDPSKSDLSFSDRLPSRTSAAVA